MRTNYRTTLYADLAHMVHDMYEANQIRSYQEHSQDRIIYCSAMNGDVITLRAVHMPLDDAPAYRMDTHAVQLTVMADTGGQGLDMFAAAVRRAVAQREVTSWP